MFYLTRLYNQTAQDRAKSSQYTILRGRVNYIVTIKTAYII